MSAKQPQKQTLIDNYIRRLGATTQPSSTGSAQGLETAADHAEIDLSDRGIADTVGGMRARMEAFSKRYYKAVGKDPQSDVITRVCSSAETGLRLLQGRDEEGLKRNREAVSGLEQIIAEDGSRPMYMINDDHVDFMSDAQLWDRKGREVFGEESPWVKTIKRQQAKGLPRVMSSVGAITEGPDGKGIGTGFLVAPDLLMTNGHVWWDIASKHGGDYSQVLVDFEREYFRSDRGSVRRVRSLAYVGMSSPDPIDLTKKLFTPDIALFVLEPGTTRDEQLIFEVLAGTWRAESEPYVFVIGHPTIKPNNPFAEFLLQTSGCKRLSPGVARLSDADKGQAFHDASTTEGSSGSVLISPSAQSPVVAVGIHYSFDAVPDVEVGQRETNLAQVLPNLLDTVSDAIEEAEPGTLEQILSRHGAVLRVESFPS